MKKSLLFLRILLILSTLFAGCGERREGSNNTPSIWWRDATRSLRFYCYGERHGWSTT